MARRTAVIDYIEEIPDIRILPGDRRYDYVACTAEGPLAQLMWVEVQRAFRRAHLTALEAGVVDAHIRGHKDAAIAEGYNRAMQCNRYNRNGIKVIRLAAFHKLQECPNLGVITVMLEEFGVKTVLSELDDNELSEYRF